MRRRYLLLIRENSDRDVMYFAYHEGDTASVIQQGDRVKIELFDKNGVEIVTCLAVPPLYQGNDREHVTLCAILYDRDKFDTKLYPTTF